MRNYVAEHVEVKESYGIVLLDTSGTCKRCAVTVWSLDSDRLEWRPVRSTTSRSTRRFGSGRFELVDY